MIPYQFYMQLPASGLRTPNWYFIDVTLNEAEHTKLSLVSYARSVYSEGENLNENVPDF